MLKLGIRLLCKLVEDPTAIRQDSGGHLKHLLVRHVFDSEAVILDTLQCVQEHLETRHLVFTRSRDRSEDP